MPLTLVTGPANAEKARVVLDACATDARAGREPLLVVPTSADVDRYRRELAERGIVFGAEVLTADGLVRQLAQRAGIGGRPVGALTRERVAAAAVARTPLTAFAAAAGTPGFVTALVALVDELEVGRIDPGRWWSALRTWAAQAPGRGDHAEDLGALYAAYRRGLDALGRRDATLHALAALDALRTDPGRWGGRPVLLYGFDDLTPLQRDVVETLARTVAVTVSLPYEAGREAFVGQATTYQELLALGATELAQPANADHYAAPALHALERGLFEPGTARSPTAPGDAVGLLRGGGERAEVELVGAQVARLLRDGYEPGEIAVAVRRPAAVAALIDRVFTAYEIPFALERRIRAGHTALGRGVGALLRCALLDGGADDLLTFLRTPGFLDRPELADLLELRVRRTGLRTAAEARGAWETDEGRFALTELDRLAEAHRRGPAALCRRLADETARLFAAPHAGRAPVLAGAAEAEAAVAGALRSALGELEGLAATDRSLVPGPADLARLLDELEVRVGRRPGPEVVTVADPLAIRARRVRALVVCGLQEGTFPAPATPEPFLADEERRAINEASGLRLALREDRLGRERGLFYAAVSRPTDRLVLSWHDADEDGDPATRSGFVDDVLALLPEGFEAEATVRRELGAAGFDDLTLSPTARESARAAASAAEEAKDERVAPLRDASVLAALRARETWSASAIETWVACPVRWFVERHLRPTELAVDPEAMVRGELAHEVLEHTLREHAADPPRPLRPADVPALRALARDALARMAGGYRLGGTPERVTALLRRLEADLVRYLEWAAHAGSTHAPSHFEIAFGGSGEDELPAVSLGDGALSLRGRIDRVDAGPGGTALVFDYKGATATAQAKWLADGKLQLALYMLALPHLLGLEAVGGLYQPLGVRDAPRPRGLLREDADEDLDCVKTDRADEAAFARVLDGALAAALAAVAEIREGRLEPRPATCGWRGGGCTHPSVCRSEGL